MERFIQLNLRNEDAKAEAVNSSKPEDHTPAVTGKTINLIANKAANRAARDFARSGSGIFSK